MNRRIWKCFYNFWKSVGLDILNNEIVQCIANQQSSNESYIQSCCSAAACIVQYIILNVHAVCDVIIARRCGTLPSFAAILLVLDCVVELWISLCLKAVMYIYLRLGSDLEGRIQGKLCSDTTTFFFVLQSQLYQSCMRFTAESWTSGVDFSISPEGDNFVFLASPAGTAAFVCAVRFTPWSEVCN